MTLTRVLQHKISRAVGAALTFATAGFIAFGGLTAAGAVGEYQCGTYGGGNYDQTDCTDPVVTTPVTGGGSTSTGSTGGSSSSSSTGSSSSSSSSSTGSSSTTTTSTILLNDFSEYHTTGGKSLDLKKGDVIYFNLNGNKHSITVKEFDANNLTVTVASTPTDVTVGIGQTQKYDVDSDGTPDIAITYNKIASDSSSVNASFAALSTDTTTPTTTGSTANTSTGGTTATEQTAPNLWWIWIIPIVIGLGLLIGAIIAIRKRKNGGNTGGGTNFQY